MLLVILLISCSSNKYTSRKVTNYNHRNVICRSNQNHYQCGHLRIVSNKAFNFEKYNQNWSVRPQSDLLFGFIKIYK